MGNLDDKLAETPCCADPANCCKQEVLEPTLTAPIDVKVNAKKNSISLSRIVLTTVGYGIVGSMLPNGDVLGPVGAVVGAGLSAYSEFKNKKLNLFYPAAGAAVGTVVGDLVTPGNGWLSSYMSYTGAGFFGWLGYYKSKELAD